MLFDTEGMEVDVILGMIKLLDRSPNVILWTEWAPNQNLYRTRAKVSLIVGYFNGKNYKIYRYLENPYRDDCSLS